MMKLYYSPGACSLATRISLHEAGIPAEFERVDLKAKLTERGDDFDAINPAGCVPVLILADGEVVTENVAILSHLADVAPQLGPEGKLARTRLIELLSFLSTELHIAFKPYFHGASEAELATAREAVLWRLEIMASRVRGTQFRVDHFTVPTPICSSRFVLAMKYGIDLPSRLAELFERISAREAVGQAIGEEEPVSPLVAA